MNTVTLEQAFLIAKAHIASGRLPQAEALCRQILNAQPQQPDTLQLLALIAYQFNRPQEAVELLCQAIAASPGHSGAYASLGEVYRTLGQFDEALACYQRALILSPNNFQSLYGIGLILHGRLELETAIPYYQQALALEPGFAQGHSNLGAAFYQWGRYTQAIASYERALEIDPACAEAYFNRGIALADQGQSEVAIPCFEKALEIRPDHRETRTNLGAALFSAGRFDEAAAYIEKTIALYPDTFQAYNSFGNLLKDQGRLEEALAAYREAIRLNPKDQAQFSVFLFALHLHAGFDARALLGEHQQWEQRFGKPRRRFHRPHANTPDPDKRLKIGYLSYDLWKNPVKRFLPPIFENHDRLNFEIFCYANIFHPSTIRLRDCADGWREIYDFSEETLTDCIREDGIDVLVDLALHSGDNRQAVFARKPAPVQVTYLAYCSTSGMRTMDYRLTDPYIDPPGSDDTVYSEISVRLPDTYWCYPAPDEAPDVTPLPALAAGYVTFGCLNNFCKVNAQVLTLWAKLLRAVPNSRLVLYARPGSHREKTQNWLAAEGVSPARVRFVDRAPIREYFAGHGQTDIALDPFPWGGGTTSCDALWMGVPLVTLSGSTAVGRGGVSILSNLALPDLIAHTEDEYIKIAVNLANDLPRLAELRATMRTRMQDSPLMDAPRFARGIEAAYRQMWNNWCDNQQKGKAGR